MINVRNRFDEQLHTLGRCAHMIETVRCVVLLALDVSARYAAEASRREFTANVSHELKTPLTSISGYAEIIESGIARAEDVPAFAG